MRRLVTGALAAAALLLLSTTALAQSVTGLVRDTSGGILPGVTVEAASPALIEKARTVVTDGSGQYRIVDLEPGTYTMTFTLPGFSTIKREGIELTGAGVITINADLRVGAVEETVMVTGATPVVDTQTSTKREVVLSNAVLATVPTSRTYGNILAMVPGVQSLTLDPNSTQSLTGTATNFFFTSRGGRGNEGTVQVDGMNVGSAFGGGGVSSFAYDFVNAQEVQVTVAGGMGESDRGGPAFNIIPKTGGNTFSGTAFGSTAGKWSQGSNLDDRLRSVGIVEPPGIIRNWDTNFAIGGPIMRDRLWFFNNLRTYGTYQDVPGVYANKNALDPTKWNYLKDPAVTARSAGAKKIESIRLTGQITPRNKAGVYWEYQANCAGSALVNTGDGCRERGDDWIGLGNTTTSPESGNMWPEREKITQATWTSPATNRLLFESGFSSFSSKWGGYVPPGSQTGLVAVTEQSTAAGVPFPNFVYRGWNSAASNNQQHNIWRASAAYVTGANSIKVGYQAAYEVYRQIQNVDNQLSYTFNNGVPTQFTMRAGPHGQGNRTRYDGFYVQDQFTYRRLTLQGAVRYEHAWSWFAEGENGILADNRFGSRFIFPRQDGVTGFHDITPRMGAAYDLFGTGKTVVKVNMSKYLETAQNGGLYTINNPAVTFQQTTNRAWTDGNGNFTPDCNLMNPVAQNNLAAGGDNCGAWSNSNFATTLLTTRVNPDVQQGWGVRNYDWQFGVAMQHQILPGVALDVSYNRRRWGNFFVSDNLALDSRDFDQVTIAAPANPNLPGGGGQPVTFLTRNARTALGATDNYFTSASDYGDVTAYWHGVDAQVSARLGRQLFVQIGSSGGRGVRDYCDVTDQLPELYVTAVAATGGAVLQNQQLGSCAVSEDWLTSVRGLVSYTVPKVDVLVSGSFRSTPGVAPVGGSVASNGNALAANYNVSSAVLQAQTGRPLTPGLAFQTVNLLLQGHTFPDRLNSLDVRFGKILRFGRTRTNVAIDLYNLFNSNTGTVYNQVYDPVTNGATWLAPTTVQNPRFARFNVTFDF
jgi:hypothetical protein